MSRPRRHPSENSRRRFTDATWLEDLPDIDAVDEADETPEVGAEIHTPDPEPAETVAESTPVPPSPPAPSSTPGAPIVGPPGREPRTDPAPQPPAARALEPDAATAHGRPAEASEPSPVDATVPPAPTPDAPTGPDHARPKPRLRPARPRAPLPLDAADPFAGAIAPNVDEPPAAPGDDPFSSRIADRATDAPDEPEPRAAGAEPAPDAPEEPLARGFEAEPAPEASDEAEVANAEADAENAPAEKPPDTRPPADPFSDRILAEAPVAAEPEPVQSPDPPVADPFSDHISATAATPVQPAAEPPAPASEAPAPAESAPVGETPAQAQEANEREAPAAGARTSLRRAPTIRTATRVGVPAVIWERSARPYPTARSNGDAPSRAQSSGAMTLPPPSAIPSPPDPADAPDPVAPGDCDLCGTAPADDALTRCPVCRRDTCADCREGDICSLCTDLRLPDAREREMLAPLRPPADGVRISPPGEIRVVTIQSGPRRELAVMHDGTVERWWRSDRAEPNHYRVNRALENHLGLRDAALLRVMPLAGAEDRDEVLQVGGSGQLVAEITSIDADGGLGAPQSLKLDATPPGPSGLLRTLAEQLECDEDAVPWVVPSGLRRYFEQMVPAADTESPATISLAPTIRRSGVKISARGLVEPNGGVAPFAAVEPGSAPPLGGRLSEWFPRPRVVAVARGVTASAVLLEVGDAAVLAVQNGDEVSYHAAAVPEPSTEEIIGGALNPDGRTAQVSSVVDPAEIGASRVINAELVSRRARPVARPSADWASAAAAAATVARFRLDQAVRKPHVELDLPMPVAIALRTELMRGGVERPVMLEVGAKVHEHWRGPESESEHVYVIYPEDLAPEAPGCPELVLDDEGHFATHARRCEYCATTRCDDCEQLVRSCVICKVDLCASCRGPATIGLPVCPACSALAPAPAPKRFGLRSKSPELLTGSDDVHHVAVERHDDGWYLLAPDGASRLPIARDYRVAGFLERRLGD